MKRGIPSGSPPPAWGIRRPGPGWRRSRPVHPHLRGEYAPFKLWNQVAKRFTPTCVGNTSPSKPAASVPTGSPPPAWGIRQRSVGSRLFSPVHPHLRGEYDDERLRQAQEAGSPPPAWGIRPRRRFHAGADRFTPTCVGNTSSARANAPPAAVHPHLRGEYGVHTAGDLANHGSPPPAWGIRPGCRRGSAAAAVHPHLRGEYSLPSAALRVPSVHPHLRGEYASASFRRIRRSGSPPPAWGIRSARRWRGRCSRFTPTCVGNTRSGPPTARQAAVHPHLRGEYRPPSTVVSQLSVHPHLRGEYGAPEQPHHAVLRFTPTCVGNTKVPTAAPPVVSVHPHLRGEYDRDRVAPRRLGRFTPTCVGNTARRPTSRPTTTVHPHLRGEYWDHRLRRRLGDGSPPPAWGIPYPRSTEPMGVRFTPTCVGNTVNMQPPPLPLAVHPRLRGEYGRVGRYS